VLGSAGLKLADPWVFGLVGGALALCIGLLPSAEQSPAFRPLHILLTVHFSVLSRVFFRADSLQSARAMADKLVSWDGVGVRDGLFRVEPLAVWLQKAPALAWAQPIAEWGILLLMIAGFAAHYTSSHKLELAAQRWMPRVPAVVVGMGLAVVVGGLSLLLAGPRANIYFAF
jgi:uncharacterized integral membrane protein